MASTRKKQIPALQRKKVTPSARARVSTSRVRKATKGHLDESFLQSSPPSDVITKSNHPSLATPLNQPPMGNQSDVMIDMLRQLTQSNQSLMERIEKIEQQGANLHHTTTGGVDLPDANPWAPRVHPWHNRIFLITTLLSISLTRRL